MMVRFPGISEVKWFFGGARNEKERNPLVLIGLS